MGQASTAEPITRGAAIALLGFIAAIKALGLSLATLSLVDATRELHLSSGMQAACASAASLGLAATAVGTGLLADRIGRRRLLMWSFALVAVSAVAVAAAPNGWVYLVGLLVKGVGYGAMFCGSYAYVKAVAPGAGLGWALGLFGMYTTIVACLGSTTAGLLAAVSWRLLFLVLPLMCIVSAIFTPRLLPVMPRIGAGRIDWAGLVLLGAGVVAVLAGLAAAAQQPRPAWSPALIVAGVLVLVVWVLVERRVVEPAFPIRLFTRPIFVAAALLAVVTNVAQAATTLLLSDSWQYISKQPLLVVSVEMQPFYLVGIAGGLVAGRLITAGRSPRVIVAASCVLAALGFASAVGIDAHSSYVAFVPIIVLAGVGLMAVTTVQSTLFVRVAPTDRYGPVTSARTTIGQLGSAWGLAMTVILVNGLTVGRLSGALAGNGLAGSQVVVGIDAVEAYVASAAPQAGAVQQLALTDAVTSFVHAFHVVMLLLAALVFLAGIAAWWLTPPSAAAHPSLRRGSPRQ